MLTDLRGINCEEEKAICQIRSKLCGCDIFFLGGGRGGGEILVLQMQSYEGKCMCTPNPHQQTKLSTPTELLTQKKNSGYQ